MTDPTYDPVLAARLRAYAEGGVRPIDVLQTAEGAIANRRTRTRRNARPALTLLAAAFLIVGAAAAALVAGTSDVPTPPTGSVVFGYADDGLRSLWRVDLPSNVSTELVRLQRGSAVSPDGRHFAWVETRPDEDDRVHLGDTTSLRDVVVPAGRPGVGHAASDHHGSHVLRLPELDVHVVAGRPLGFLGRVCWRGELPPGRERVGRLLAQGLAAVVLCARCQSRGMAALATRRSTDRSVAGPRLPDGGR